MSSSASKLYSYFSCLIAVIFCISCGSDCSETLNIPQLTSTMVYDQNIGDIQTYLTQNSLIAKYTESGLHYVVNSAGTIDKPSICDQVNITYKGYLLSGEEFDSGTLTLSLTNVIKGWQEGVPFYGIGGSGVLLIPSYLAYGINPPQGSIIKANDVLLFDITLNDF